jgi:hypothetical protein
VFGFVDGSLHLAAMLAVTACVVASVAATVTGRLYQSRTCALIRATAEVTREVERSGRCAEPTI